jgi:hypothetical protein
MIASFRRLDKATKTTLSESGQMQNMFSNWCCVTLLAKVDSVVTGKISQSISGDGLAATRILMDWSKKLATQILQPIYISGTLRW